MQANTNKERTREKAREKYQWYKSRHICVQCHKNEAIRGQVYCYDCREKRRKKAKKYYRLRSDEAKQRQQNNFKKWVDKKKAAGLCTHCGKYPAQKGKNLCGICNAAKNAKQRKKYRKNHPNYLTPEMRRSGEFCYRCEIPLTSENRHGKLCLQCYEKACINMSKAAKKARQIKLERKMKNECK